MRKPLILFSLVAFYLVIAAVQASLKLIWVDEFITLYIAQVPHFKGIWHALQAGADPNPPLMHLLVKASTAAFGANALAMRFPSVLCVLLAILAIWWMLNRWVAPVYATAGGLAFMATRGFDYAYDARSYGLLMGFCMASLACWMTANDTSGSRRILAIAGMSLMLAAGLSSNYYGVLAFFPVATGEVLRKRVRPGVWVGMALASLPLVAYLPLLHHNIVEFAPHAWNRPQPSMVGLSYFELVEGIFWPVLGLAAFALWRRQGPVTTQTTIPRPEAWAVAVLLIYPILGFAIALAGAGMISPRCVAPVCCGFGLAAGLLGQRVFGPSRRAGVAMVAALVLWVTVREGFCASLLLDQRRAFFAIRDRVAAVSPDPSGTILVADSSLVLPLFFYSADPVRRHIVVPIDFAAIHRLEKDDSGEQNLWAGRNGVFPFPVTAWNELPLHQPLTVLTRPHGWLAEAAEARGLRLLPDISEPAWDKLGGVFTPMAHPETRILHTIP